MEGPIPIGSIMLGNNDSDLAKQDDKQVKLRNVVFNVKSIRALQSNLGVLSV